MRDNYMNCTYESPVKRMKLRGYVTHQKMEGAKILVNPHQEDDDFNEVLLHEIAHAFWWGASEEKIEHFAAITSQILKKFGR